jgi:hypothetical protein
MNEVRTRVHTAALVEALRVVRDLADSFEWSPALDRAINAAVVKADEAHACAVDDMEEHDRYQRHAKMIKVAKKYYALLEAGKRPAAELKTKLDKLLEPFSDDPAFVAFCQMKRAVAGLS